MHAGTKCNEIYCTLKSPPSMSYTAPLIIFSLPQWQMGKLHRWWRLQRLSLILDSHRWQIIGNTDWGQPKMNVFHLSECPVDCAKVGDCTVRRSRSFNSQMCVNFTYMIDVPGLAWTILHIHSKCHKQCLLKFVEFLVNFLGVGIVDKLCR